MSGSANLGATPRDSAVAALRGIVGAIPGAGPALAELSTMFLTLLADRLKRLETVDLARKLRQPESIDLFEDGAYQAARALSEERREQIARLVADSISGERRDYLESKRVL
jgi:hypothetical protein